MNTENETAVVPQVVERNSDALREIWEHSNAIRDHLLRIETLASKLSVELRIAQATEGGK